jgi:hypothetical protein
VWGATAAFVVVALFAPVARADDGGAGPDGGAVGDAEADAGADEASAATPDLSAGPQALAPIEPAYTPEAMRAGISSYAYEFDGAGQLQRRGIGPLITIPTMGLRAEF